MPSLREVQRAVRRSLVHRDASIDAFVLDAGVAAQERVAIYRHTFESNLVNALRLSYPAVHRLVGDEFFVAAVTAFIAAHPPVSAYLDEYGTGFAVFLATFPPAASVPYLSDVAQLEWAVTGALHAPDVVSVDLACIAALSPAVHERIRFTADPSITMLSVGHPVDLIWRAVLAHDDRALGAIDVASGPVRLMIERRATGIEITRMDEHAWSFASALVAGVRLGEALEHATGIDAPALLARHLAAGRFIGFTLAPLVADRNAPENAP
jgi:hypothetical protein